jgi:hypothetical protein
MTVVPFDVFVRDVYRGYRTAGMTHEVARNSTLAECNDHRYIPYVAQGNIEEEISRARREFERTLLTE